MSDKPLRRYDKRLKRYPSRHKAALRRDLDKPIEYSEEYRIFVSRILTEIKAEQPPDIVRGFDIGAA